MYGHPKHKRDMSGFGPPVIKLTTSPSLSWRNQDSYGVSASGWNPLKGLGVTINDESGTNNRISIFIEPPAPGTGICCMMFCVPFFPFFWPIMCPQLIIRANAHAFIFAQNEAGVIDLLHRQKPFFGSEIRKTYHDCTHFCAVVTKFREAPEEIHDESISQSSFILTYRDGEIRLPTGENFSTTSLGKLNEIADVVNSLIATSMEQRHDLNCNIQPSTNFTGMAVAEGYYMTDRGATDGQEEPIIAVADGLPCIPIESVAVTEEVGEAVLYRPINY